MYPLATVIAIVLQEVVSHSVQEGNKLKECLCIVRSDKVFT